MSKLSQILDGINYRSLTDLEPAAQVGIIGGITGSAILYCCCCMLCLLLCFCLGFLIRYASYKCDDKQKTVSATV